MGLETPQIQLRAGLSATPTATYGSAAIDNQSRQIIRSDDYHANIGGRLFLATSATGGIALIVAATTGNHPTIWNPANSGVNINIKKLVLAHVSGTDAPTSLCWNIVTGAGTTVGTGLAIVTFTSVAVASAVAGGGLTNSKVQWSNAVSTYTAAPAYYRPVGLSLFTGADATASDPFQLEEKYNGDFIVSPGTAVCLVTKAATTSALFRITIIGEEIDI